MPDTEITLRLIDFRIAAAAMSLRLDDPSAEERRLSLVAELLRAQGLLGQAFAAHLRHSLSECRGTHSRWDIQDDAERLWLALEDFESSVRQTARELGPFFELRRAGTQSPERTHTTAGEGRQGH